MGVCGGVWGGEEKSKKIIKILGSELNERKKEKKKKKKNLKQKRTTTWNFVGVWRGGGEGEGGGEGARGETDDGGRGILCDWE